MRKAYDLIVVGGGPAGSTLASLVRKYDSSKKILLLESSPKPRHKVGESLLPGSVDVLKEMDAFDAVDRAGFLRKVGATYAWGPNEAFWVNDFNGPEVESELRRGKPFPKGSLYAWQVDRSRYDEILLKRARRWGVEVERGTKAVGILESDGRVVGAKIRTKDGILREVRARWVADCSGRSAFLSKYRSTRVSVPELENVAGYAHFKGGAWPTRYLGRRDKTKILVNSAKRGWFWYIPLSKGRVSVGFVTRMATWKASKAKRFESLFLEELKRCRPVGDLLSKARRIEIERTGKRFLVEKDWSYRSENAAGPGWFAAGDACAFVDPILSTGVMLAHQAAHRAAYTLLDAEKAPTEARRERLWEDYRRFCRENAAHYFAMTLYWYGNDRNVKGWWRQARKLRRAWAPGPSPKQEEFETEARGALEDRLKPWTEGSADAFRTVAAGLLPRFESSAGERRWGEKRTRRKGRQASPGTPRLRYPFQEEFFFLPKLGTGTLKPIKRLRFLKRRTKDPILDAANPRVLVLRPHVQLLEKIDGKRSWSSIRRSLLKEGVSQWWLEGPALDFLAELEAHGVLK